MFTKKYSIIVVAFFALILNICILPIKAGAVAGNQKILSLEIDRSSIDPKKGQKVEITYETQTSTATAKLSLTMYDEAGNVIFEPLKDGSVGAGVRAHSYSWDGMMTNGQFFVGTAKIDVGLTEAGVQKHRNILVDVVGNVSANDAFCAGFKDVPKSHKYCVGIEFVKAKLVMTGDAGVNTFRLNDPLNRAEAAKIITSTFNQKAESGAKINGDLGHPDIQPGAWYVQFIYIAKKFGVLKGDPSGTMRPGDNVNRAEFAVMFFRAAKMELNPYDTVLTFTDVPSNSWFKKEANAVEKLGLMDIGTIFEGSRPMTRGEVAEWIYRFNRDNLWSDSVHI